MAEKISVTEPDDRIGKILDVLLKYIDKDFSHTIPISKNEDEIDAISAGLNTMAEELQAYIAETKKQAEQIKRMNAELEQKVLERTERLNASEDEYRSLIEQATDGIFISDQTGKYLDVNLSATKMLGYSKEELLRMSVHDVMLKDDVKNNPPRFNELLAGDTVLSIRHLLRKDGTILPVEINGKQLPNGKILGMVRDITDRKAADEKLKSSETRFRNLTETAFDAIVIMNESGKIVFWNRAAELLFGYSEQEVLQKTLTVIMPDEYREKHQQGIERYLKTGEKKVTGKVIALEGKKKNGDVFPIEVSITAWESGEGKMFSGIIRDITERKETENRILKLNESLEEKVAARTAELQVVNKELESFSYSVSHDLRAPLRSISGYTKILEEDFASNLDAEGKRILGIVQRNVNKMNQLIEELLEFSRVGKKELTMSNVDMEKVVRGVVASLENSATFRAVISVHELLPVYGDESLLIQVWTNLISNAVKYSSKKDSPQLEIGSHKEATEIIFYVKDNGAGFDMEYANKLFEVFQRLHRTQDFEGTGVGLSIVKRIITKHGGRVWAEGKVDEGATFYFALPVGI